MSEELIRAASAYAQNYLHENMLSGVSKTSEWFDSTDLKICLEQGYISGYRAALEDTRAEECEDE